MGRHGEAQIHSVAGTKWRFIACSQCVQSALAAVSDIETAYFTQQTGGLTRGVTLRAIQATPATRAAESDPQWLVQFRASLAREDLSPATLRGYVYDLRHFLRWHQGLQDAPLRSDRLVEYDLIAYAPPGSRSAMRTWPVSRRSPTRTSFRAAATSSRPAAAPAWRPSPSWPEPKRPALTRPSTLRAIR